MKKTFLGKLLIVITIVVLLLNFYLLPPVQAGWLEDMLTSVIALLTLPIRAVAIACGWAINALTAGLAYMEGTTDGSAISNFITPFDILFNKVQLFDINFFDIKTSGTEAESLVNQIRLGVAGWYYALRSISAAILLCILIYVGIRMAITTIASDKAMYKKMLVDWVASMLLLFLMHYIMIFTINVNNTIINALSAGINSAKIEQIYEVVKTMALDPWDLNGLAATAIYCMLVWQTLGLVFAYFNRLLKLAFLTIIAPLVTITYSLDKMGDGKAQALNNWLKEYIYTILIQPFHCVIYMSLIDIGLNVLIDNAATGDDINVLAAAVISMMCVKFTKDGEQLVRKIFAFQDDGSTGLGAGLAVAAGGLMYAKNIGRTARSTVNGARNLARTGKNGLRHLGRGAAALGRGIGNAASGAAVTAMAAAQHLGAAEGDTTTFSERREAIKQERADKKAEQEKATAKQHDDDDEKFNEQHEKIAARAEELKEFNPKLSNSRAMARARKEVVPNRKERRKHKKQNIGGVRKTLSRMRDIRDNSTVIKGLSDGAKITLASGAAMFVGSGSLGVGQDFSSSLMTSAAVFRGTNEYMKGTRTTLRRGVKDHLQAMGINSKEEVNAALPEILNLHGNADAAKDREEQIMKELETALQDAGLDTSQKSTIKNNIQRTARANPGATESAVNHSVTMAGNSKGRSPEDLTAVHAATQKLADFYNGQEVYKSFETAANFGLKSDTFAADVMKGFYSNTAEEAREDAQSRFVPSEAEPSTPTTKSPTTTEEKTPAEIDYDAVKKEREDLKKMIDGEKGKQLDDAGKLDLQMAEEQLEKMDRELDAYLAEIMNTLDNKVKQIVESADSSFKTQADEIIRDLENKIGTQGYPTDLGKKISIYRDAIGVPKEENE